MTTLQEFATAQGIEGTDDGVVRGVKVLGFESRNNREYNRDAVTAATGLYGGIRVNVDHPLKATESRSYADRFG